MDSAPASQMKPAPSTAANIGVAIAMLLVSGLLFSGCAPSIIGVGTAAVAASSTEKGLSTSVSDGVIFTKIQDRYIQEDASLPTVVDVTVNDGAVLLTGKVKTPEEKVLATKLAWEVRGVREVVNELQVSDTSSIKDMAKDLAASAQRVLAEFQHRCGQWHRLSLGCCRRRRGNEPGGQPCARAAVRPAGGELHYAPLRPARIEPAT